MRVIANIRLIGMLKAITTVGLKSFKNNARIKIASRPPMIRLLITLSVKINI